jgi:hypothetical protein
MTPEDKLWKRKQTAARITLLCLTVAVLACALLIRAQFIRSEPFQMRNFFLEHHEEFVALGSQFDAGEFDHYETCKQLIPAPPEVRQWAGESARIMIAPIYEPARSGSIKRESFSLLTRAGMFYYIPAHLDERSGLQMCHYGGFCGGSYGSGWYRCIFTY